MTKFIRYTLLFSPLIFLLYTPWTLYPAIFGRTIIFQVFVEIVLLIILVFALIKKEARTNIFLKFKKAFYAPLGIGLTIFTLTNIVSFLNSVDQEASFWGSMSRMDGIFTWLHVVTFFFFLVVFLETTPHWKKFLYSNAIIAGILSILAIIQHFYDLLPGYILQSGRVYATFGNPVFFAPYLLFTIFLTLSLVDIGDISRTSLVKNFRKHSISILFGLLAVAQIIALFLTDSQGAIFGFILGIFITCILFFLHKAKHFVPRLLGTIIILAFGVFIFFRIGGLDFLLRFNDIHDIEDLPTRLIAWSIGFKGWLERPLLGFGPSTFEYVFDTYYEPKLLQFSFYETVSNKPHNIFIEALAHLGIIGFVAYLFLLGGVLFSLWRLRKTNLKLSILGGGLFIAYLVTLQFVFDTTNSWYMLVVFLAFITKNTVSPVPTGNPVFVGQNPLIWRVSSIVLRASVFPVILASLLFGNIDAWLASVPAAKAENVYLFEKPIKWGTEIAKSVQRRSPYHDEIRVIMGQDLMFWEAHGGLIFEEAKESIRTLRQGLVQSVRMHSNNFQYHLVLGQVQGLWAENFEYGAFEDAIRTLRQATVISPKRQSGYLVLAKVLLLKNDLAEAERAAVKAVQLYEQASDPHWFLGLIKNVRGKAGEAVLEFGRAYVLGYKFKPQEIIYWMQVNRKLGKDDDNRALQQFLEEKIKELEDTKKRLQ